MTDAKERELFQKGLDTLMRQEGGNLFLLKRTENKSCFQVESSIAYVELKEIEENVTEIDLVWQIMCNVRPFSEGK